MERIVVSVQTENRGLSLRIAETMALRTEQIRMIPGDPGERGSDWDFILITEAAGAVPGDLLILPGDGMIRRLSEQQEQGREESLSGISRGFMPGQVHGQKRTRCPQHTGTVRRSGSGFRPAVRIRWKGN